MHAPLQPAPAPLQPAQAAPVHEPSFGRLPIDRQEAPWKGGDRSDGRDEAPWKNGGARPQARRAPAKRRNPTFQANPLVVAAAVAITGASLMFASDWLSSDTLVIHRIDAADAPVLDGDTSDRVWRNIEPISVLTNQGGNLDGKGDSRVEIRAAHDGEWAYFLFTWEDPTRSLKQLPMVKERNGWHLLQNGYWNGDEHDYNEDKFSVLFTTLDLTLAGDRTFHASPEAVSDAPSTKTGRGLHYTPGEGIYADVWQWKATSGGPTGWLDDDHFGPPLPPTPQQAKNLVPYKGGFEPDPGTANYSDNFVVDVDADGNRNVTPRRLPKDVAAMTKAMGDISLDPNVGESDGARWFMTETESVPYSTEADQSLPIGTVIPGVIIAGDYTGDRADVRCAARWAAGHWALEVARRMDTHSKYDIPFKSGIYMRVSVFDHVQVRHTRHVRPIRVEVE
jgi:Ethylbenzene dehydrogenase